MPSFSKEKFLFLKAPLCYDDRFRGQMEPIYRTIKNRSAKELFSIFSASNETPSRTEEKEGAFRRR